jgi:hypothetical protein
MKMITVTELQKHLKRYLREAQTEEIVITLDDGTLVELSSFDEADLLDAEIEQDPRFTQIIAERRGHYQQSGGVPLSQVRQSLVAELTEDLNHSDAVVRQEAAELLDTLRKGTPST